jgi:nitroreductase
VSKGSDVRRSDHPISTLFLDRWSPRAMTGEPISEEELMRLFEAARWAPSASNTQPWRMLYARRDTAHWPLFFDLLVERNQLWCRNAAALVLFVSETINARTGRPMPTPSYDTGAAWASFALQGVMNGLVVHGMRGFDAARARDTLRVPEGVEVEAMAAVGRPGRTEDLPDVFHAGETPNSRRPLAQTVCEGPFAFTPDDTR